MCHTEIGSIILLFTYETHFLKQHVETIYLHSGVTYAYFYHTDGVIRAIVNKYELQRDCSTLGKRKPV